MNLADANRESTPHARPIGHCRRLLRDERGAAATELAMIAPIGILMLGLLVLGGQGFELEGKVALAAHTITDLVAKTPYVPNPTVSGGEELNQSDLDTDLALSSEIVYPNPDTHLSAVVSELLINSTTATGTVVWSEAYNGATKLAVGAQIPLSTAVMGAGGTYLIYGQAWYVYSPLNIAQTIGAITLTGSEMLVPRNAAQITINWGQ